MLLPLSKILYDDDFNTRGHFSTQSVEELADSIKQAGLIQPITVRPREGDPPYHLVAGHRRYQACKLLGWKRIQCVVKVMTDHEARVCNLQENLARVDLTPSQELVAILSLYGDTPKAKQVALDLGRSQKWVNERLAIRKLDPRVREDVDAGLLTALDITCLICTPKEEQFDLAARLKAAHAVGESTTSIMDKLGKPRRVRGKRAVITMITELMDRGYEPRGYRCLAWAAGTVPDEDLMNPELD